MHKNATKCNKTQSKWCINKDGASKIIDTFETYHSNGMVYLSKLNLFILYLIENILKILDMFKGGEKIHQIAAVFIGRLCLLLF
jgi:hypothetical protein